MRIEYLLVLMCVLLFPFALSFDPKLPLRNNWGALVKSILLLCVPFWIWDIIATARGHWSFSATYTIGVGFLGLPIEEWLFFVVVSFVSIFTWESTKYFMRKND